MAKVAAVQMCSSHLPSENLKNTAQLIEEAATNGAKLIVLPEMFAIMRLTSAGDVNITELFKPDEIQFFSF